MTVHATLAKQRGGDKRSSGRKTLRLTTVGTLPNRQAAQVLVHDLSPVGMLVESAEPLITGEIIAVELPRVGLREATVVWSSKNLYGCSFKESLPAAGVSAALLKASPSDKTIFYEEEHKSASSDLAGNLTALREERGLSIEELAKCLGVSRQALWYWETGQRFPRTHMLKRIAQEFGISPSKLSVSRSELSPESNRGHDVYSHLQKCKAKIADDFGIPSDKIKITIEFEA